MNITKEESNYIKLIGIILMTIDHIGLILFPAQIIYRIIGRLAFPCFAYQIGIGCRYTRDIKKYFYRLLMYGSLLEIVYMLVSDVSKPYNIFITLAAGVFSIVLFERKQYISLSLLVIFIILTQFLFNSCEYGIYGVLMILLFYIFPKIEFKTYFIHIWLLFIFIIMTFAYVQAFSIFALPILKYPFKVKYKIPSSFFYIYYPVHIAILYIISIILS